MQRPLKETFLLAAAVSSAAQAAPSPADSPPSANRAREYREEWGRRLERPLAATNSLGMKLMLIPPGEFVMGSPPTEQGRQSGEKQHGVKLTKAFYMAATEVSQKQWQALMGGNPSFFVGGSLPVDTVTWDEAVEFCHKLSEREHVAYSLPTEAQWEYACRAGTTTPFHTGATIATDQANYNGEFTYGAGQKGLFREETTKVGSFPPNAWGLHDMHGNVWEWCADWYGDYPAEQVTDPTGPPHGEKRAVRGGCWINFPAVCRSANRGSTVPRSWNFHFGFRVIRALE
jgi:formylglycine-generating enzyme required for sulfatase activity